MTRPHNSASTCSRWLTQTLIALCVFVVSSQRATAQWTTRGAASDKGWRFAVTPYVWLAGLKGDVGVGPLVSNVDLSTSDLLKALNFAAMAYVEARRQWFVGGVDALYVNLSGAKAVVFRGDTGTFNLKIKETLLQPFIGYSLGNATWTVDVIASTRYWNINADLNVDRANGRSVDVGRTIDWWDALGGLRVTGIIVPHLRFTAAGDAGGGGADSDWQAHAEVGYDVSTKWTVGAGYRIIGIDYTKSNFVLDLHEKGFLVAGTYRF